ncbi:GreA/GreB family elongation factor [Sphingomonas naphthae]|uniref:GreA/GreB family elongation factor n=1 Tax=Sphingomonas naphthae TaxID=1813468 RepID=A0ABY7TM85_9SPHN|nr:GreA/GreB family elongation factor [Sphingomonas naphthae]WCT74341.1 GreA/GreB family elongation factor [Sphingomonas naphthae]
MSVAFRRESDEEHKEPKFELPIPAGPNYVTPRGQTLIVEKVAALEAALASAEEAAREEIARDLRYWRTRQATALPAPTPAEDEAGIGSRVRFRLDGREREIGIVGDDEADPAEGLIAFSAPLARAMMGAMAGEHVDFGGRREAIEVLAVA